MSAARDRCYMIPTRDGSGQIRVRAAKPPKGKALRAIQDLFEAAYKFVSEGGREK